MVKNLVIVESPAKARTIARYLGKDYEVVASVGHVRDLPAKKMAVDINNEFHPEYEIMPGKKSVIQKLKQLAKTSETIYLATDPDREGEAISWHILEAISTKKATTRVTFHEITERGIREAFKNPTSINMELVNAQQARRILDRVVGYELSPLLWRKFSSGYKLGLSAGRVQSVALIVERERAIASFVPEEYWNISVHLSKGEPNLNSSFTARISGSKRYSEGEAKNIEIALRSCDFNISNIGTRISKSKPPPAFTTSTMQQEASRRLRGFSVSGTMRVAQQLYEGIQLGADGETGLITYMRTDSTVLSSTAVAEMSKFIKEEFGNRYLGTGARITRRKKPVAAQEAHEAIRPTSILLTPENLRKYLSQDQLSLYTLIWKRALASRMADAENRITSVTIQASAGKSTNYKFVASGSEPEFDGYQHLEKADGNKTDEAIDEHDQNQEVPSFVKLPPLSEVEKLHLVGINNEKKFTRPLPRYTQATFVKTLEESGIGRPSTYASIMATLEVRNYCSLENGRYRAELLGEKVVEQLDPYFPNIMDVQFTANMETNLDEIANGNKEWVKVLKDFYGPYRERFLKAEKSMPKINVQRETGESCPECERPLAEKFGRNGKFIACTGFPDCRYTKPHQISTGVTCPHCTGDLLQRRAKKRGSVFYGCSNYPACDFSVRQRPILEPCPECGGLLIASSRNRASCIACHHQGEIPESKVSPTEITA